MPTYLHPGVYIEEIPGGARAIESAGTSTAVIIGFATKGIIGEPQLIFNFDQYVSEFGGISNRHGQTPDVDYMGHAVQAFFDNGGGKAYIVRLASGAAPASAKLITAPANAANAGDIQKFLSFIGASEGKWADGLVVKIEVEDAVIVPARHKLSVGRLNPKNDNKFIAQEVFSGVTLEMTDAGYIADIVNRTSKLIRVEPVDMANVPTSDKLPYYLGRLTSDDLSGLTPTAIAALIGKKFKVTLDSAATADVAANADIEITLTNAETDLAKIATKIQQIVNAHTPATTAKSDFKAVVGNSRLVLTSGTRLEASSVAVTAAATAVTDASAGLKLTSGTPVARTGAESFFASFHPSSSAVLGGGNDGQRPVSRTDYQPTFAKLRKYRDVNIMMIPDHQWKGTASQEILNAARSHAEDMQTCMVLIDPPRGTELKSENDVASLNLPGSTYTALYYPWVHTANPHYHPELRANLPVTYLVPPSGFAAGMWARTDARRGVWKAPAGLATGLTGIARTEYKVGNDEQDGLNPSGVNCFRNILSEPVIWGSRTLATKTDPEWRYVPVRRTALMIEESIFQGIQWAVFEPNDHNLWASLRVNIATFMDGLHRSGAFQGQKASDAYFVRCGLGDTMTQGDIDAGRVIVLVGFAPLKPAEFVIVRIQQKVGQQ